MQLDINWCIQTDATIERGRERCRVVDLIKINAVRQESNHREREEGKHRGVALMGSIDRAWVWGQWLCPWWPIPHWLDDSHQESSVHVYLTHSHPVFPPFLSSHCSIHSAFSVIHLDLVIPSTLFLLSLLWTHWLISSPDTWLSSHHLPPSSPVTKQWLSILYPTADN